MQQNKQTREQSRYKTRAQYTATQYNNRVIAVQTRNSVVDTSPPADDSMDDIKETSNPKADPFWELGYGTCYRIKGFSMKVTKKIFSTLHISVLKF